MNRPQGHFHLALAALIIVGLNSLALAQSSRGSLSGTVTDPAGAAVANGKITARNTQTGAISEATSTGDGNYRLPELAIGTYTITVTSPGFKTAELKDVPVEVNTVSVRDVVLEAGAVSETVSVTSDAPTVQSESSDVGTVVGRRQVLELPLIVNGVGGLRTPESFVFLSPGTVGPGTADDNGGGNGRTDGAGQNGGAFVSKISGGQNFANEVLLDGASIFRTENGASFDETAPSLEALQEFKLQTSTLPAEFGRTGGGITSFSIKSGTNDFHGDGYEFFRNRVLDANRFFNNARGIKRPLDNSNDYGFIVGGPIFAPRFGEGGKAVYNGRNRSFFFFAYEGFKRKEGGTALNTLPTDAFRRGDFSSLLTTQQVGTDALGRPIFAGQIFDPATARMVNGQTVRDPFPGNMIPLNRFSNVARNLLNFFPATNAPGQFGNFAFSGVSPITANTYTIKIDHSFSERSKLTGSYSRRVNDRIVGVRSLPDLVAPDNQNQLFTTRYLRLIHDYTFSPTVLNHFNAGYNRTVSRNQSPAAGQNIAGQIGLTGVGSNLFPRIEIDQISTIGNTTFNRNTDNGLRVNDSVSVIRGANSFKFGGDFRYQQYTPTNQNLTAGRFGFGRQQTGAVIGNQANNQTGFGFASFLLGQVGGASLNIQPNINQYRSNYYALFAQDDLKVTRNLVLNLGLRYDVEVPRRELHNRTSSFDPTVPNPGAGGRLGAIAFADNNRRSFADTYYKDFGPRLGFAYSPDRTGGVLGKVLGGAGKTVFRGGYGIYYEALQYAEFGEGLQAGINGRTDPGSPNGFDPAFNLDQGFPSVTIRRDPTVKNGQGGVQFVARGDGRPAMVQNYSVEVQRELAKDLILDLAYVGASGRHLRSDLRRVNTLDPQFLRLGNLLNSDINSPEAQAAGIRSPFPGFGGQVQQALRPFPQYQDRINTDCCLENDGSSSYNSFQAKLERRFTNGLNLLVAYTFSKTLTNADSALPIFATFSGGGSVQNPFDRKGERALSNQDIPHSLVISYIYELPVGKGKTFSSGNNVVDKIIGGFQVGAVHRYQSGQPFSFGCASGIPGYDTCIRFNRVPGQPILSEAVRNGTFDPNSPDPARRVYFNRAAFADPNANRRPGDPFRFGDMPRVIGDARSPMFSNEDISILKKTPITENVTVEFRTEIFNVFNRVNLRRAITDVNAGDFGRIFGTTGNPRTIQFGLKLLF